MMSTASSTAGDAMNYVEDTIGEELEKTALKGIGRAIANNKGKSALIGATVGLPVAYSLLQSAREADREAGGIPQALDDAMDGVDSGLDEVDRVMDEGLSDKQKALAALGALGLAGVGGYKAYKSLSGREKVSYKLDRSTLGALAVGVPIVGGLATIAGMTVQGELGEMRRRESLKRQKALRERRNKELAALAATGLIAGAGGYALGSRSKRGE